MTRFQSTHQVIMIEPKGFYANPQTLETNQHQQVDDVDNSLIQSRALKEHQRLVKLMLSKNIEVTLFQGGVETPDDLFCNNWISFHQDGPFVLYPLLAPNRRLERREDIIGQFKAARGAPIDLSEFETQGKYLESTGSMVLDRVNKIAYAALSPRTDRAAFEAWCDKLGFKPISFRWYYPNQKPVYHTNVIMFIGTKVAAICSEGIDESDKANVLSSLNEFHEVVDLSYEQINHFSGNALELRNTQNQTFLAMSQSAFEALNKDQKAIYDKYYDDLIVSDISTIEQYGGGSVRCLILEVF